MFPCGIHESLHQPLRSHLFQICRRDRQAGIFAQCMWEKLPVQ